MACNGCNQSKFEKSKGKTRSKIPSSIKKTKYEHGSSKKFNNFLKEYLQIYKSDIFFSQQIFSLYLCRANWIIWNILVTKRFLEKHKKWISKAPNIVEDAKRIKQKFDKHEGEVPPLFKVIFYFTLNSLFFEFSI